MQCLEARQIDKLIIFFNVINNIIGREYTAGNILMAVSGMHISWGIWRADFFPAEDVWISTISRPLLIFTVTSWYITAIMGSFIGSFILTWQKKKVIYVSLENIIGGNNI